VSQPLRWGMTIPLDGPLHAQRDRIVELEALGYSDLWSAESNAHDAFTPLALASVWAPSLRLGTAIVPAYTRGKATLAQCVGSIAQAAPGRFALGLGALPPQPVPILVAALREGMLRLAGREGDGAIINWLSAEDVATVAPVVRKAAADAGRPEPEICARIFVAPTTDRDTVMAMGKYAIAAYLTVPVYAAFHEWLGRGEQLAGLWAKWGEGDRKGALAEIPDELVDQLLVHGSPDECHEHLQRYVANGVTTLALAPLPFGYDVGQAIRDLAPR